MDTEQLKHTLCEHFAIDPATSRILIVGLGVTGWSVARFLQRLGLRFAVTDSRDQPPYLESLRETMPDTPVFSGRFDPAAFAVSSHLIMSPGVALDEPLVREALARGARLLSDIDVFAQAACAKIIAITGSNGKSTVTTLFGAMAQHAGRRVAVGGNLGTPALDLLAAQIDLYVLELSSFQLELTKSLRAHAATVLNVTPDHIDRHGSMEHYAAQKARIFRGDGVMVLNRDDPIVWAMRQNGRETLTFSTEREADFHVIQRRGEEWLAYRDDCLMPVSAVPLTGRHNLANVLAAWALGRACELPDTAIREAVTHFQGLPHRMQKITQRRGITFINDSKATNIGACIAALQGLPHPVVLIAGGDAKGADMQPLAPLLREKTKALVLIGKDAPAIESVARGQVPTIVHADSMRRAVALATELAAPGDTVLLSPACASLDQYKNYQDRGEQFAQAVRGLPI